MLRIRQRTRGLPRRRGLLAALAVSTLACAAHGGGPGSAPYPPQGTGQDPSWAAQEPSEPDVAQGDPWPDEAAGTEELDREEELRQLLAEAAAVLSNASSADAAGQEALGRAMEELQRALEDKARLLEEGGPQAAAEAEVSVATGADRLRAALDALRDLPGGEDFPATGDYPTDLPRPGALERVTSLLDSALQVVTRIQELRAAFQSLRHEDRWTPADAGAEGGGDIMMDEPVQDVSGVVTKAGAPLAGAVVSEPGLGLSATTEADGSYTLEGVPARLTRLVVSREGRPVGEGIVNVARGRPAIADFQVGRGAGSLASRAAVLPSDVSVPGRARSGQAGTVEGLVEDAEGRPLARTLVRLQGLGAARTDSRGRYAFRNVPAGSHQLTVTRAGAGPYTERLRISAAQVARLRTRLDASTGRPRAQGRLVEKNARTLLEGRVLDDAGRPLAGARVAVISAQGGVSVRSGRDGAYRLRDLKPGPYRVVVSKAGVREQAAQVSLRSAASEQRDFRLAALASPSVARALNNARLKNDGRKGGALADGRRRDVRPSPRPSPAPGDARTGRANGRSATPPRPSPPRPSPPRPDPRSEVTVCVTDDRNGRALEGATVVLTGAASTGRTGRTGSDGCESFPAAPGALRVRATKAGYAPDDESLRLAAGQRPTVRLSLRSLARSDGDRGRRDRDRVTSNRDRRGTTSSRSGSRSEPAGRGPTTTKKGRVS